jgi:hypothetical protein
MPRRLRVALGVSFALNAALILAGRYRLSYDAYIHMFFADHYRLGWWTLWEPRWYGGFSVASYPPLVHQLIALLSLAVGVEAGYALLSLAVLTVFPLGVYGFARIFKGGRSAQYAALAGAVVPAVYYSAHTFGQLPTLFSLLSALFCIAVLARFLRKGHWVDCLSALALAAVVAASHHATLLFMPPAILAVAAHLWLNRSIGPRVLLARLAAFALPAALAMLLVVWPFWVWGSSQTVQTTIDHPSRHNFIQDALATVSFFLPMYGPLVLVVPWAMWRTAGKRMLAPGLLFSLFFLLGLGDTTPLPRVLFGAGWAWLTYDRFALWACVVLLIFLGELAMLAERRLRRARYGSAFIARTAVGAGLTFSLAVVCIIVAMIPSLLPTQPGQLDMLPITRFLAANNSGGWYYLTFGFGDQLAVLSRLTPSHTLDGSYHTARQLPELRSSGLAQMDTAFWFPGGMAALDRVLDTASRRGARWGFVNRKDYMQLLRLHGWRYLTTLSDGVQVWENPAARQPGLVESPQIRRGVDAELAGAPLPIPRTPESPLAEFSWGILPLAALTASGAIALSRWRPWAARGVFSSTFLFCMGLLPLALSFWYFRPLAFGRDPRVYLTYGDANFYLSDGLILLALAAWACERFLVRGDRVDDEGRMATARRPGRFRETRLLTLALVAFAAWSGLSVLWSIEPGLSLAFALQVALLLGLYLSLRAKPEAWGYVAWGCAAALSLQLIFGFGQLIAQSTAFMGGLGMLWPGPLTAAMRGASVVQLADGARWLRLYGSLPHPNVLAGLLLLFLVGTARLALKPRGPRWPAAVLFGAGVALLVLTFSRAAWLALAAGSLLVALRRKIFDTRRLVTLASAGLIGGLLAALPFSALVLSRLGGVSGRGTFDPEVVSSVMRGYLSLEAGRLIELYPLLGSGAGTFVAALSRLLPPYFDVEPVHNMLLLGLEELGPLGGLLALAVAALLLLLARRALSADSVLLSALVLGLLVVGLFDHYLWTLPPMRAVLWLSVGLMVAQVEAPVEAPPG